MADNEEILPNSPEDSSPNKPLTEEQEEALNKIMAELQGAKDNEEDNTSTEKNGDAEPDGQSQEPANGLTDEQEEALQRIMAEIEGTSQNSANSDKTASNTSITAEQEDTLNKIVAELQDNAPSDISDNSYTQEDEVSDSSNSGEPGVEDLSPEQEAALQKIMAEIESKSPSDSDSEDDSNTGPEPDQNDTAPAHEPSSEESSDESGSIKSDESGSIKEDDAQKAESSKVVFEELDLSEFESELQKVVSEAKKEASNLNQKPFRRQKTAPVKKRVPLPDQDNAPPSPSETQKVDDEATDTEKIQSSTVSLKNQATENDEVPSVSPIVQSSEPSETEVEIEKPKIDPVEKSPSEAKTIPLEEVAPISPKVPQKSRLKKTLIGGVALIAIIFSVVLLRWIPNLTKEPDKSDKISTVSEKSQETVIPDQTEDKYRPPSHQVSELTQAQNDSISTILQDINNLRSSILDKIKEINDLRLYYEQGIRETEQELIGRISDQKFTQLKDAVSDQRIELGLHTIQRRKGYIVKLKVPFSQLLHTSEELLYLERKANIFIQMIENTSGINLDPFEKQVSDAIKRIRATLNDLSIDQSSPDPDSLENIWQDVFAKVRNNTNQKMTRSQLAKQNETIWNEICSGNFNRKWALTQLSEKAAQCLLQWDAKDLYLNQLTSLTPEVAQILSHWQGEWLGLNGLETLSPEVARHLARWRGKRLSLNGLTELSPKATLYLSEWQGNQLELIGLKHIGQWENPKVQLFVSDKLRSQIPK